MRYHSGAWLGGLMILGIAACGSNKSDQDQLAEAAQACLPPEGRLAADARAQDWAGEYLLTLVTTFGDSAGRQTTGRLALSPMPQDLKDPGDMMDSTVTLELYGTSSIDASVVNAVAVGALDNDDPTRPGVLVLSRATSAGPEVTIRLGSEANRRGMTRFDGGYWALQVLDAGDSGIRGTWSTGVTARNSAGHFCAVPVGAED